MNLTEDVLIFVISIYYFNNSKLSIRNWLRGGVEVILRVREAKTKKCAILWTPNVTVVPAQAENATGFIGTKNMKK